jgi:hypothetical protein
MRQGGEGGDKKEVERICNDAQCFPLSSAIYFLIKHHAGAGVGLLFQARRG